MKLVAAVLNKDLANAIATTLDRSLPATFEVIESVTAPGLFKVGTTFEMSRKEHDLWITYGNMIEAGYKAAIRQVEKQMTAD